MPPRPVNDYNPVPSIAPQVQSPPDYLRPQATPGAFGGQIGAAEQQAGAQAGRLGDQATQVALQAQGMINETLATNGESGYLDKAGAITAKFRALQGLAAVSALPQYKQDITNLRQEGRTGLPGGAARAYDLLTIRHEGYYLNDADSYVAQQVKVADTQSAHASMTLATSRAGDLSVAGDDKRFNDTLQDSDFQAARIISNQGYGAGTGMTQDPATGAVSFDETTPQGKEATAVYNNLRDTAHGAAWENRLHALADQNVTLAYQKYQQNRASIPGETQVKLDAFFTPRIRSAAAAGIADTTLSNAEGAYRQGASALANAGSGAARAGAPNGSPMTIADAIHAQESGGNAAAPTSAAGAKGGWQILPATFQQYAKPGESIDNPADNAAVGQRIVADLSQKYGNDPARVAVAYFSGPGNVAPPGSPTPWIRDTTDQTGKSVSSYVADVTARTGSGQGGAEQYRSRADFYRSNYAGILQQARTVAETQHPDDPTFTAQATARVEQRMNDVIRQQELSYKTDSDMVYRAFTGALSNGHAPSSISELTAIGPDVKAAWERMQSDSPLAAANIENRILTANSRSGGHDANTYGSGFYKLFQQIHAPIGDPNRVTDPTQLYGHVGSDLTVAGLKELSGEISERSTPAGEAAAKMKAGALAYAKHQLSFAADYGSFKIPDPKGEDAFNVGFLPAFYKTYDAGIAAGKTPYQLLSRDSPDFILDKVIAPFRRPQAQMTQDMINAGVGESSVPPATGAATSLDLSTPQAIVAAYQMGHLSKAAAEAEALKRGFIAAPPAAPTAPAAPSVPLAR